MPKEAAKSLVVIPSVRNPQVIDDYIDNANLHHFNLDRFTFLILTEDFVDKKDYSKKFEEHGTNGVVMNERDRREMARDLRISKFYDVFPQRSHAETSYGLLYMAVNNFDYGFFIDDDTRPIASIDYFRTHLQNLGFSGEVTRVSSSSGWVNVLYRSYHKHKLYPRGFPYSATSESVKVDTEKCRNVVVSQGLWTNIPDLDAVRILSDGDLNGQAKTRLNAGDFGENFTVKRGQFTTVCSMNLAFKKEIIPAFYQFKMDDNPWRIGRFDDIWSGIVVKRVADALGKTILNGHPLCEHNKAPRSTFKDLNSEAPGLESNEWFSKVVGVVRLSGKDESSMTASIGRALAKSRFPFIRYSGNHLLRWLELLDVVSA